MKSQIDKGRNLTFKGIPVSIMILYEDIIKRQKQVDWQSLDEHTLWKSLVFCLLSSNVYYETTKSAFEQLCYRELLTDLNSNPTRSERKRIANELKKPLYLPRKIDGSFRRYRYPQMKATQIVEAAKFIYSQHSGLRMLLKGFNSSNTAREFISDYIPGLGYKESSHFLRNIGYCDDLAIIDVHIMSFLKKVSLIDYSKISITKRIYIELEKKLLDMTSTLKLNLAAFDMAVWRYEKQGAKVH